MPVSHLSRLFYSKWLLLSLLIIFIAAGAFLVEGRHPYAYYLSFYIGQTGEMIYQMDVKPGDTMLLNYIHSVDGTPISARFEIRDEVLHLIEESYSWYGSGLESGAGYQFAFREDQVIVSGYERIFEELPLRVARTVPQEIMIEDKGEVVSLQQLAPGGTLLIIRVNKK